MVENWVAQIISWLPELCSHLSGVGLPVGQLQGGGGGHVGLPDCVMGRIWQLGDRLFTALHVMMITSP